MLIELLRLRSLNAGIAKENERGNSRELQLEDGREEGEKGEGLEEVKKSENGNNRVTGGETSVHNNTFGIAFFLFFLFIFFIFHIFYFYFCFFVFLFFLFFCFFCVS